MLQLLKKQLLVFPMMSEAQIIALIVKLKSFHNLVVISRHSKMINSPSHVHRWLQISKYAFSIWLAQQMAHQRCFGK